MPLGEAFSPAVQQDDPRLKRRRLPVQQALQTVQLKLPTATGGAPAAGGALGSDLIRAAAGASAAGPRPRAGNRRCSRR